MFFRLHVDQPKTLLFSLLLLLAMTVCVPEAADAKVALSTSAPPTFTSTDDASIQLNEFAAYVAANNLTGRVVQIDLTQLPKVSQYTEIDSSAQGFGPDACGLVATVEEGRRASRTGSSCWARGRLDQCLSREDEGR